MKTIADWRRAATPGSRWLWEPVAEPAEAQVHVVASVTATGIEWERYGWGVRFPARSGVFFDGDTVAILDDRRRVVVTWTLIPEGAPDPPQPYLSWTSFQLRAAIAVTERWPMSRPFTDKLRARLAEITAPGTPTAAPESER